jgi:hypothetical protein
MELRNCAYPEPSHIHVPRPSRSENTADQVVSANEPDLQGVLTDAADDCETSVA